MMAGIGLMHGIHLDPTVGDILVIILVQEHLAAEGTHGEISPFIAAPGIGILIAFRQRYTSAAFVFREPNILMGYSAGTLQIARSPGIHFLCAPAGARIPEQNVADPLHGLWSFFRNIQL